MAQAAFATYQYGGQEPPIAPQPAGSVTFRLTAVFVDTTTGKVAQVDNITAQVVIIGGDLNAIRTACTTAVLAAGVAAGFSAIARSSVKLPGTVDGL